MDLVRNTFFQAKCQYQVYIRRYIVYILVPISFLATLLIYQFLSGTSLTTLTSFGSTNQTLSADVSKMPSTVSPTLPGNGSTPSTSLEPFTLSPEQERRDFWIGLILAVSSSLFIGSSFILKKLGLLSVGKKEGGVRAGAGGHQYLLEWKWWSGMTLMIGGEVMNFVAYAFAPATLVTPLGALSVISSAVLASYFLKERLNLLGKVGCFLCILGSTVMVIHSPKEAEIQNMEELLDKVKEPGIIVLVAILIIAAAITIIFIAPKYGQTNVVVYVFICATLGALTVMGCKGVGVALKETFAGRNEFTNWLTYVMLGIVVVNILFQLNYLNKALDTFNTAIVTPTYYVMFTACVILVSLVLFKEFLNMTILDIIGDLCGFLTIVCGIFLLNAFKDMDITLKTIPKAKKDTLTVHVENGESKISRVPHDHTNLLEYNENSSLDDELGLLIEPDNNEYSRMYDNKGMYANNKGMYDNKEIYANNKGMYDNKGTYADNKGFVQSMESLDENVEVTHF